MTNTMNTTTDSTANIATNSRNRRHRTLLWTALALSALCNAGTSIAGLGIVSIVFGVLTLLCGAGLVVHYRWR
ncbi:hypothetical protein [Lentzea xinjiangensis]|nr:hypothetical protein [Lentzea xinjiangensis]